LRLLLCTSKPEDFVFFEGLRHLETGNIISDAEQAIELLGTYVDNALQSRLTQLRSAKCRDIFAYNALHPHNPLPPFVIVVDELADLADQLSDNKPAREAFYTSLRRVAQLGRSRGVHLILCTQRPSADLVPTNIRTLMNARAALRVNDGFASRMILDENGAENLQSRGDILFKYQGDITHVQGYFISTNELIAIIRDL